MKCDGCDGFTEHYELFVREPWVAFSAAIKFTRVCVYAWGRCLRSRMCVYVIANAGASACELADVYVGAVTAAPVNT